MNGFKIIMVIVVMAVFVGCEEKKPYWVEIARGNVVSVDYLQGSFGAAGKTIISFKNGGKCVLWQHHSMSGGNIIIYEMMNRTGYSKYKTEKIKEE